MRSRTKPQKEERDVRSVSPASKSILKKTKEAQEAEVRSKKTAQTKFNLIQPNEPYTVPNLQNLKPPLGAALADGNATEAIDQLGTGTHAVILDQRFQQYLQGQKKLAYELGDQKRAIQNLQFSLQERVAQYDTTDLKIWRLTETMSEIAMHFAIQMTRLERDEEALEYLNLARKALEPLPGSEWGDRHEWQVLRRDLYKNLAIFNQNHEEWQKAFDNLRFAISHERILGESTANTSLTCAVLLSKMHRFAECIEYGQQCCNEIEQQLKIDHLKPLAEYKYTGKSKETMLERDKQFTTYGIANHLLAKALLNLQYYKEARFYLNKASVAINKCLNQPKRELSVAIGNDMARIAQIQRGTTVKIMTAEQVQGSLITIKADLATRAMSGIAGDRIEQRIVMKSAAALEGSQEDGKQDNILQLGEQLAEQQKQQQEQKPEPKVVDKEKEATRKALLEQSRITGKQKLSPEQLSPQSKKEKKSKKDEDSLDKIGAKEVKMLKEQLKNKTKGMVPTIKKETRKKSLNVKTHEQNPAKVGADVDPLGIKYSEDRSIKSYLRARKKQIRELNKDLGYSESDQSLPDVEQRPDTEENKTTSLPPIQKAENIYLPKSPQAKIGIQQTDQASGQRRNFSYTKKPFIDARPDQPNSNNSQLLKAIQSSLKIKLNNQSNNKQKSPEKSYQSPSEEYSDDVADDLAQKLQRQVKSKDDKVSMSPKDIRDDKFMDLSEQIEEEKQSETEKLTQNVLQDRNTEFEIKQKKVKSPKSSKMINQQRKSSEERLQKQSTQNRQNQSTPRVVESIEEQKLSGQDKQKITNKDANLKDGQLQTKPPQAKSQKTMRKINMFQQQEQPEGVLSTLKRQRTPPLLDEIAAMNPQLVKPKQGQKSVRQPKQQEIPQQQPKQQEIPQQQPTQKTPFAPQGKGVVRNSLLYAVKHEKGLNTGNEARGGPSVFAGATPTSASKRPTSTDSTKFNPLRDDDKRVNIQRLGELAKPKQILPKQLTEEEIEQQNAKLREYYERKKRYMKFDFAEYVSRDEFLDPQQYQIEIPKQYSQRQLPSIDAIQKQRAYQKKLERDQTRQAFLSERKALVKSQSVDANTNQNQLKQANNATAKQDKVLIDEANRDKFYELLSPTSSQEANNPFINNEENKDMIFKKPKPKNQRQQKNQPYKRQTPSPTREATSGNQNFQSNSESKGQTGAEESPGSGQDGSPKKLGRASALLKNTTKAIIGMKRGGKAPTQTLMMKKKISGKAPKNPYDNYDPEQDSEIL